MGGGGRRRRVGWTCLIRERYIMVSTPLSISNRIQMSPEFRFHRMTRPSYPPVATKLGGTNTTDMISSVCPFSALGASSGMRRLRYDTGAQGERECVCDDDDESATTHAHSTVLLLF